MEFRCPMHDILFQTETDHTKPGTPLSVKAKQAGKKTHPKNEQGISGHPDCPLCMKDAQGKPASPAARSTAPAPGATRRIG